MYVIVLSLTFKISNNINAFCLCKIAAISLLLLTWSIPSYTKAVKRARGEDNLTNCNKLLLFLWNVLQIGEFNKTFEAELIY